MPAKRKPNQGIRYTTDQKRMILTYVKDYQKGGIKKAVQEFGVSAPSIYLWMSKADEGREQKSITTARS